MSMFGAVKSAVFGQAMRLMSDPRLSKVVSDPRVMNAAMKALSTQIPLPSVGQLAWKAPAVVGKVAELLKPAR